MAFYRASLSGGNNTLPSPWADVKRTDTSVVLPDENGTDVGVRIGYDSPPPYEGSEHGLVETPTTGDASWVIPEASIGAHSTNDAVNWVPLRVTGLTPGNTYNVRCFGSYGVVGSYRTSQWRVNGGADVELVCNDGTDPNTANDVRFNAVTADVNGDILIEWREGDTSGSRGYGNAIYIEDATDTTAPTYTVAPNVTATTETGHTISSTLDEAGTIYGIRMTSGATAPTDGAQCKAWHDAGATGDVLEARSAAAANSADLVFSTGSATTAYDYYIVAEDDEGTPNLQASPTLVSDTTSAAAVPGIGQITAQFEGSPVNVSDWQIIVRLVSDQSIIYNQTGISSDASGIITAFATTSGSVGDAVRVEGHSVADGYSFVLKQNLENTA